jgi:hypothetical protein
MQQSLFVLASLTLLSGSPAGCRADPLTEQAVARFQNADYPGAIQSLQEARILDPDDADIYFQLGRALHYLCYDSVPLTGFDQGKSDEILGYLRQAVQIDPSHGDARYFLGAEYGARARAAMQSGRRDGIAEQFRLGYQAGGYPDWLIESGRNTLRPCDPEAILFVGGDADANAVQYLQYVEGFRNDVTVVPVGLLDFPWFISLLRSGGGGVVASAPISWSDQQIAAMRPYKWKPNRVSCRVSEAVKRKYGLGNETVAWELNPDLGRGEQLGLVSAGRAALTDILLTNRWERPVYFSLACPDDVWRDLPMQVQLRGFVHELLPFEPDARVDADAGKSYLLDPGAFRQVTTYRDHALPRAAAVFRNYRSSFLQLVDYQIRIGDLGAAAACLDAMEEFVPPAIVPLDDDLGPMVEAIRNRLGTRAADHP